MIQVVEVPPRSDLLAQVRKLWRAHSSTLGYFPEGAFDEHAVQRWVLAATTNDGRLAGYLLFRQTRSRGVAIVHLCVDPGARRAGVARLLFGELRTRVASCNDICVRCRRDFDANAMWPRLGFVAVREEPGRGRDGQVLTQWRFELNPLPLLAAISSSNDALRVAIDANVFFDLDEMASGAEESKSLLADWLSGFIELCVTEEILNEIHRHDDPAHRDRQRTRVLRFTMLPRAADQEDEAFGVIMKLLPNNSGTSSRSDARQLAKTVAAGIGYFVTRDADIRDQADELYERFGLTVVSPFELILRFDELRREEEYRPRRLFLGPLVRAARSRAEDLEEWVDLLHTGRTVSEPRRRTLARLRDVLADPVRFDSTSVRANGALVAAYVLQRLANDTLNVPYLAVSASPDGRTTARHFVEQIVGVAARERRGIVSVATIGAWVEEALREADFSREGKIWVKLAPPLIEESGSVARALRGIQSRGSIGQALAQRLADSLERTTIEDAQGSRDLTQIERILWPAKIIDTRLPCFVVPIQPRWAKDLFDRELASGTLFGALPHLALNSENAYYRAARPSLPAPARVLWYVSQDAAYPGSMAVRACSYLDEVVVARPKSA